ncbi:D-alanyl-D-alanine carboxypeptidase, partial [Bacillus thuringiensis]|nr:D-alanyl-D-alanine carboxypeptidase [Bacillus thuringiensis]
HKSVEKRLGKANASMGSINSIDVRDGRDSTVPVVLKSPVEVWVRNDMDTGKLTITPTLDKKQVTDNEIQAPMDKGTKIGTATITLA